MKIPRHIPEWSDEDWADWDKACEEAGCEKIPEDDPYYTNGASFTFLSRTSAPSADNAAGAADARSGGPRAGVVQPSDRFRLPRRD